ncbi:hypothetical protein [Vibrio coralliirubri]|uniref:hypothetical protein n=1 Tax=Vibrio coralliirubri TaxID=1516159 RepID=UPI000769D44C|nr:hypothetical protein [Vibrio coralliirubri]
MKNITLISAFLLSTFVLPSAYAISLPSSGDENWELRTHSGPPVPPDTAINSLSIITKEGKVYANNRAQVRAIISYDIAEGNEVESLRLLESRTRLPLSSFGITVDREKNGYKPGLYSQSIESKDNIDLLSLVKNSSDSFIERYIRISNDEVGLDIDICVEITLKSGETDDTCSEQTADHSVNVKTYRPLVWKADDFKDSNIKWGEEDHHVDNFIVLDNDGNFSFEGESTAILELKDELPKIVNYNKGNEEDRIGSFTHISQSYFTVGEDKAYYLDYYLVDKDYNFKYIDAKGNGIHLYRQLATFPMHNPTFVIGGELITDSVTFFDEYGNESTIKFFDCDDDSSSYVGEVCIADM